MMHLLRRRLILLLGVLTPLLGLGLIAAPSANAVIQPFTQTVDIKVTIPGLGAVSFPQGTMASTFDTDNGKITGNLSLPQTTIRSRTPILGLPIADITIRFEPVGQATGQGDFHDNITMNQLTNFRVVSVRPVLTPWLNLAGNNCRTNRPVQLTFGGNQNNVLTGNFTFPYFSNCLLQNISINSMLGGKRTDLQVKLTITSGDNNH